MKGEIYWDWVTSALEYFPYAPARSCQRGDM
jgi:hypothetical protein